MTTPEERWAAMLAVDSPTVDLEVKREHIEPGRSFSADAMDALNSEMGMWVGTRVMRRWTETGEPPSALRVTVTVDVA